MHFEPLPRSTGKPKSDQPDIRNFSAARMPFSRPDSPIRLNVSYVLRDNVLCAGGNSKIFCQLLDSGGNGRRRIGFGGLLFDQRFDCLRTLQPVAVLQGMSVVRCVGMPFNSDLLSRRHIRNLNLREALPGVTRVGFPALRAWFFLSGARLIVLQEAASEDFPLVSINKFPGTPSRLNV